SSGSAGATYASISGAETDRPPEAIAGRLRESRITPTRRSTAAATLQPIEAPIICSPVENTPTRNVAIAAARKRTLVAITGEALLPRTRLHLRPFVTRDRPRGILPAAPRPRHNSGIRAFYAPYSPAQNGSRCS